MRVKIKEDLSVNMEYISPYMLNYAGREGKVTKEYLSSDGEKYYQLDIDKGMYCWYEWMLKPIEINNIVEQDEFIKEYEKIVKNTMELCKRKNKDYGNATDRTFKQFGDISYQVRCFDKWNRINTLLENGKAEISESLEDSLLDLANYLFLWVTSRKLK